LVEGEAGEEKSRVADWEVFEVFDIVREGPCGAVFDEGKHELHHLLEAASVWGGKGPKVVSFGREAMGCPAEYIHIEEGVAVGLGAREFEGKAAVGSDLRGDEGGAEAIAAPVHDFGVVREACELACLKDPAGSVIVIGVAFFLAVF